MPLRCRQRGLGILDCLIRYLLRRPCGIDPGLKLVRFCCLLSSCTMFCDAIGFSMDVATHAVEHVVGIVIEYTGLEAVLYLACRFEINFTSTADDEICDRE
jgi:hypothetical protein